MKNVFLIIMVILIVGCSKDSVEVPTIITDLDGNVYNAVVIGKQTWMKTNLNVSKYQDGTLIPEVTDPVQWAKLTTGAWCYYESTDGNIYGKLYNWYAVAGIWDEASKTNESQRKQLAPTGYKIPSDEEWTTLTDYIGGGAVAGGKMKEIGIANWTSPNSEATNSTGFTGLPGGIIISNGTFYFISDHGYWWSSTSNVNKATDAWNLSLGYNSGIACRSYDDKNYGFSVRCIKK